MESFQPLSNTDFEVHSRAERAQGAILQDQAGDGAAWGVAPLSVLFVLFIYLIELLVAFLQAYIFTLLSAVFIGLAVKEDH